MIQQLIESPKVFIPTAQNIIESVGKDGTGTGNILLKHVLVITAEEKNGNERYYSKPLWEREVDSFNKKIQQKTTECVGELDHPEDSIINLKNGSHIMRSLLWEENNVFADIEILCDVGPKGNEAGRILGSYLRNGLAVGFSTRGMGSLEQMGEVLEVQDDFEFTTIDAVSNPSNVGSWSKLNESKNPLNNHYFQLNQMITEILCSKGTCPVIN